MDKTSLQQALSRLEPLDPRDAGLEQYQTPAHVAADVLHRMELNGELQGKVVDLGCGNGIFTIGAALMGAEAVGIDVDTDAVETARENFGAVEPEVPGELGARFVAGDVRDADMEADSVVTNPPFGIQRKDANLVFLEKAFETAPVVYALLHRSEGKTGETRGFLERAASDHGFESVVLTTYDFTLPRSFGHHESEKRYIKVDLYRFEQV